MTRALLISLALSTLLLFNSCDSSIEKYNPTNDNEKEIISLLNTYCDARNSANLKKLQSIFHDDGVYISGDGGQFTKEKILETNPKDWLDHKVELYNPEIKINGNKAQVITLAKYFSGTYKVTQYFDLVNDNNQWLIMKVR
jgi:hypothetical protein